MQLDIRYPIGLMFLIIGIIVTAYGVISDKAIYQASLGININLWWGVALIVFSAIMLLLARAADAKQKAAANQSQPTQ
jgi:hypothetical protein